MESGVCKLCKKEKLLCKKSHIIPKHAYKILKNDDNFCLKVDKKTIKKESKQKDFSGIFESYILCKGCECTLNEYEIYANDLIYRNKINNINTKKSESKIIISGAGYDYEKIKLYFLSILWRSSISSNKFFNGVALTSCTEENIRTILLTSNLGEDNKFSIIISLPYLMNTDSFNGRDVLITQKPYKSKINNFDAYIFLITGQSLYFIIGEGVNLNTVKKENLSIILKSKKDTIRQREKRLKVINNML